jgi:hypothetical protein
MYQIVRRKMNVDHVVLGHCYFDDDSDNFRSVVRAWDNAHDAEHSWMRMIQDDVEMDQEELFDAVNESFTAKMYIRYLHLSLHEVHVEQFRMTLLFVKEAMEV